MPLRKGDKGKASYTRERGKRIVMVDKRMKSDRRGMKRAEERKKKRGKK